VPLSPKKLNIYAKASTHMHIPVNISFSLAEYGTSVLKRKRNDDILAHLLFPKKLFFQGSISQKRAE
jgi:hypothetical protein